MPTRITPARERRRLGADRCLGPATSYIIGVFSARVRIRQPPAAPRASVPLYEPKLVNKSSPSEHGSALDRSSDDPGHSTPPIRRNFAIVGPGPKSPFDQGRESMSLTLEEANRILAGALAKARELNIKVSAAVCDSGGRLVALQRMDNAIWASAYGSQGKAVASAAFGRPSGEMAERADQPTPRGIAAASGGQMIMGQGAVPIIRNGVIEGACGVGGGTSQQDEDCARAGIAKLYIAR